VVENGTMHLLSDVASGIPGIYPKSCGCCSHPYISKIAALFQLFQSLILIVLGQCSVLHIFPHMGLNVFQGEMVAFFKT